MITIHCGGDTVRFNVTRNQDGYTVTRSHVSAEQIQEESAGKITCSQWVYVPDDFNRQIKSLSELSGIAEIYAEIDDFVVVIIKTLDWEIVYDIEYHYNKSGWFVAGISVSAKWNEKPVNFPVTEKMAETRELPKLFDLIFKI